jgi:hypothetical protein
MWRGKHDILYEHDGNVEAVGLDNSFENNFLEVVICARKKKYHTLSYKSSVDLKALLHKDVGMKKMFYKLNHLGKLGDSPSVPEGIEVNTCVIRFYIISVSPYPHMF